MPSILDLENRRRRAALLALGDPAAYSVYVGDDTDAQAAALEAARSAAQLAQRNAQIKEVVRNTREILQHPEPEKKPEQPKKSGLLSWWSARSNTEKVLLGVGAGAGLLGVGGIVGGIVRAVSRRG